MKRQSINLHLLVLENLTVCLVSRLNILISLIIGYRWVRRITVRSIARPQPLCISGKRKRKLLKKWRREQKDAIEKGLVSMEDVEMAAPQGTSQDTDKMPTTFHMKKSLKLKQLKRRGKNKRKSSMPATEASVDAMVE
ncbi:hypothetical protein ACB092_12G117600 [Castanea dentata]